MQTKSGLLAETIRSSVLGGAIGPGQRLSSVRSLAALHSISIPTVLAALRQLEAENIVESRPRSGYYVCRKSLRPLATIKPHSKPRRVGVTSSLRSLFDGPAEGAVPLGAALPDPDWLPLTELRSVVASTQKRLGPRAQSYSLPPGRFDARRQVARLSFERGTSFGPDDVIMTSGTTEAILHALNATCQRGDTVMVEAPTYFGHLCLLEQLGLKALEAPTDPVTGLNPDAVEKLLSEQRVSAILCTPTVQNPLGATMPQDAKRRLVRIAHKAKVPIIEDDVYGWLDETGTQPPLKAFDDNGSVLYCGSVSKCLAPGWRVGWIAPGRYYSAVIDSRFIAQLSGSPIIEAALATHLADPSFKRHIERFKRRTRKARNAFTSAIEKHFPEGTKISKPRGGYLIWTQLPSGADAIAVSQSISKKGISVSPGPLFSATGRLKQFMRLNVGHDFISDLDKTIQGLGEEIRQSLP